MTGPADRIAARFQEAVREDVRLQTRADLSLADYRTYDDRVELLIAVGNPRQAVTLREVDAWVINMFDRALVPLSSTCRSYLPHCAAVTIVAEASSLTKPFDAHRDMVQLHANAYISPDGGIWDVRREGEVKFLVLTSQTDIKKLIDARRARMLNRHSPVKFADLQVFASHVAAEPGDYVRYIFDGNTYEGTVAQSGTMLVINAAGGAQPHVVPHESVVQLIKRSAELQKETEQQLADYFNKAYGPGYGDQLVGKKPAGPAAAQPVTQPPADMPSTPPAGPPGPTAPVAPPNTK